MAGGVVLAVLTLCAAERAASQGSATDARESNPAAAHKVVPPMVLQQPNDEALAQYSPRSNPQNLKGGQARLHCIITLAGQLTGCAVTSEEPAGSGFGAAALNLAPLYRLTPETIDGTPVAAPITLVVPFPGPSDIRPASSEVPAAGPWQACASIDPRTVRYYPELAQAKGLTGSAEIQCRLGKDGTMAACSWISEGPPASGFGESGSKTSCLLKMKVPFPSEGWIFRKTTRFDLK